MNPTLKLKHGYWYLATPYSKYPGGKQAAFEEASRIAAELLREGIHVYCAISHTHPMAEFGKIDGDSANAVWAALDLQFMQRAYGIIICEMPSWESSTGIAHELAWFKARQRPVAYLPVAERT